MAEPLEKTYRRPPEYEGLTREQIIELHADRLETMRGIDLNDPEVMKGAWREGRDD